MHHPPTTTAVCGLCLLSSVAAGQSLNIRFGSAVSTPSPAYAAAGLPGVWNTFQVPPGYAAQPLVGLDGTPASASFYQYGSSTILAYNNPLTTGDDEKLMDSMILSTNSPTDGCFWVQGLTPGPYEVIIYAMTPNDPARLNRTRVDDGTPGPVMVGGAWPGQHQAGVTFAQFEVTTASGVIAFHDGLYGGMLQSGINGVQLRFLGPCAAPTFSAQPISAVACPNGSAQFSVIAAGDVPLSYQWQVQVEPGEEGWRSMGNDPGPLPCGGGAFAYAGPINSPDVHIGIRPCPGDPTLPQHFQIRCIVSNGCATAVSNEATYTICPADFDCDSGVDIPDLFVFLGVWFAQGYGADFDDNGVVAVPDIFAFLSAWFAGCT